MTQPALAFLPSRNPIQRVNEEVEARLLHAQASTFDKAFHSASTLCERVFSDLKLNVPLPESLADLPAWHLADQNFTALCNTIANMMRTADIPPQALTSLSSTVAERVHLLRAFEQPDVVLDRVVKKVLEVTQTFPREASDIEQGRNPGDVIDPYILAATKTLLYGGDFKRAVGATVAHKALMIIEGLLGHLHEDIIGEMRGNVRAPEPRGFNQEHLDLVENPFPGADIVQPPTHEGQALRFHQVKSKTGSAKGGDGRRLGEQLKRLKEYYQGEVYYDALIGSTLRGHRSMSAVLKAEPSAMVLVGEAAFKALTGSPIGSELLMRVYQTAFTIVAKETKYNADAMSKGIVAVFKKRAEEVGEDYLETILRKVTEGPNEEQDSRLFKKRPTQMTRER